MKAKGILLLAGFFTVGVILVNIMARHFIKSSGCYDVAAGFVRNSDELYRVLGDIQQCRLRFWNPGEMHLRGDHGMAELSLIINGSQGSAKVHLQMQMESGVWRVTRAELIGAPVSEVVELTATNAPDGTLPQQPVASSTQSRFWVLLIGVALAIWFWGVWNQVQLFRYRRPGVSVWQLLNPFTLAVLDPHNFTLSAIKYRKRLILSAVAFGVTIIFLMLIQLR